MFVYDNNEQLRKEIKKIIIDSNFTQKEVAEKIGIKPQQLVNILKKQNFAFKDVKKICNAIDIELVIDFKYSKDTNSSILNN